MDNAIFLATVKSDTLVQDVFFGKKLKMPDSLMYRQDAFVVLEPNQPEQFLTPAEMLEKLKAILATRQDNLPPDLQKFPSVEAQAQYLLETSCELDMEPGQFLQWYVVRLEK